MREMTLAVVGIDFPNADGSNRRSEALMTLPGDRVGLLPEPRNRHDPHAVAVIGPRGVQLGYVNAERAPLVAGRIARGAEATAVFQGIDRSAAYVRVRFGGGAPTLPPERGDRPGAPAADASDGFYPDEDGPEWGA